MSDARLPTLALPLQLPCGVSLKNRLGKAPLTEGLADPWNRASERHVRLYRAWAEGGAGLVVTGNVQIDRRYLERPGNVVIDRAIPATIDASAMAALRAYAEAGAGHGTQLWMQLNHPGRQTPRSVCSQPVAPSAVPLNLPSSAFAPPRALTADEIFDIIERFTFAAKVAQDCGFGGVQVHAAHGYLLSQFLTPLVNQRTDEWGGSLERRARLLLEIVRAIRRRCGPGFPISAKLNSSDFQQGGFSSDDCLQVVRWLEEATLDHLEISGGNYEQPSMMGSKTSEGTAVAESTVKREAYFMGYAERIRAVSRLPLMVTGGFRTRAAMEAALASDMLDMIGLGRPMCVDTDAPNRLLAGAGACGAYEKDIRPAKAGLGWFCLALIAHGDGRNPDTTLSGEQAIQAYLANEQATAGKLADRNELTMPLPSEMTAIAIREPGGPEMLVPRRLPMPVPGANEILVKVHAAGINRGDMVQRQGHYPPPPGAPDTPGLEIAGEVAAIGAAVARWQVGDRVCALVGGGGYAEYCLAHEAHALPVPPDLSMVEAAALPEVVLTVWTNVFERAHLKAGESLLVQGGASGIGTMAIQLGKAFGARVFATAGSAEKCAACERLGADRAINYRRQDFVAEIETLTSGRGVDVILDMVGGDYIARNIAAAARDGRIVSIAFLNGSKAEVDFRPVMLKRLTLTGSTLRGRSIAEKAALTATVREFVWPLVESSRIKPIVDKVFPLTQAAAAHALMETGDHTGKIMLSI